MSRRILILVLVATGALAGACTDEGDSGGGDGADRVEAVIEAVEDGTFEADGEEQYKIHCAVCHGGDGQGGSGPELAGQVADKLTVAQHVDVVMNGRAGMPAWASSMEDDQIAAIVAYERDGLGE
jgi:mono/diheme cytochrome c family protein